MSQLMSIKVNDICKISKHAFGRYALLKWNSLVPVVVTVQRMFACGRYFWHLLFVGLFCEPVYCPPPPFATESYFFTVGVLVLYV